MAFALLVAFPVATFANSSVDFTNAAGTLSGSSSGLSLSGSILTSVNGLNGGGLITGNLGTVTFGTGALLSGSLAMGGTFAGGGSFTITGNGTDGIPNGVIFSGSFQGPVTWTLMTLSKMTLSNGTHSYSLTCVLVGSLDGVMTNGVALELTISTGIGYFTGSTTLASGETNIQTVPEPGGLALMGTGLIGFAGMFRRRLKS